MGSMGNGKNYYPQIQSMRPTAGVHIVILPNLKTFLKPRQTLPFFSGSPNGALIEDWFQECEKTAKFLRWPENKLKFELIKKLRGDAFTFHKKNLYSVKDYQNWRDRMIANYSNGNHNKDVFIEQLTNLKQKPNQSVMDFAQEITSLMVKTLGLAVIMDKALKTLCFSTKLAYFSDGLREDVRTRVNSFILTNRGRMPSWSRIVERAQDAEWLIDLIRKKSYCITPHSSQYVDEHYTKVYITISVDSINKLTGYGVFFGKNDSKNIGKVSTNTCNVSLIIAAIEAIKKAKSCGMDRLVIYTSSEYLLKFIDKWAISWLERNWTNIVNVNFWRDLLVNLKDIDVKWVKPNKNDFGYSEAGKLAKIARSEFLRQQQNNRCRPIRT